MKAMPPGIATHGGVRMAQVLCSGCGLEITGLQLGRFNGHFGQYSLLCSQRDFQLDRTPHLETHASLALVDSCCYRCTLLLAKYIAQQARACSKFIVT